MMENQLNYSLLLTLWNIQEGEIQTVGTRGSIICLGNLSTKNRLRNRFLFSGLIFGQEKPAQQPV